MKPTSPDRNRVILDSTLIRLAALLSASMAVAACSDSNTVAVDASADSGEDGGGVTPGDAAVDSGEDSGTDDGGSGGTDIDAGWDGGTPLIDAGGADDGAVDAGCDDADGDGVCDAEDVCSGADDALDADHDGTPDACDCDAVVCSEHAVCTPSNQGATCTCDDGYEADGDTCEDVDECAAVTNPCGSGSCENLDGAYECSCASPDLASGGDAPTCRPVRVLVLDDGGNTGMVDLLEAEGFEVTDGGLFYEYDGTGLSRESFDTVLWLQGSASDKSIDPGVDQMLVDFVEEGGGLVRSEWALWWAKDVGGGSRLTAALMPAEGQDDQAYGISEEWTVVQAEHPLAAGISSATFASTGAYTNLILSPGAVVVMENDVGQPAVSYTTQHGGCTVHVNDDLLYVRQLIEGPTATIQPEVIQAYINAVYFSANPTL